ncbi:MAG: MgtC/SapB family protein [Pirellulaceae bacterium]
MFEHLIGQGDESPRASGNDGQQDHRCQLEAADPSHRLKKSRSQAMNGDDPTSTQHPLAIRARNRNSPVHAPGSRRKGGRKPPWCKANASGLAEARENSNAGCLRLMNLQSLLCALANRGVCHRSNAFVTLPPPEVGSAVVPFHGFESCVSRGDVMSWNGQWEKLGRRALAAVVGGLVGLEREFADKPARLRTHMFVAAGAALLMLMGNELIDKYHLDAPWPDWSADPI